jgi:hypothetical protein
VPSVFKHQGSSCNSRDSRAVPALQTQKKEAAREQELAAKHKEEEDARHAALEESKKIVLRDHASVPKPTKTCPDDDEVKLGTRVKVFSPGHCVRR